VFVEALGNFANALFLLASVYIFVALIRQIAARPVEAGPETTRVFGLPEAILAGALTLLFVAALAKQAPGDVVNLRTVDIIKGGLFLVGLLLFVILFLKLRRFDVSNLAGFSKLTFARATGTGLILLAASWPLIVVASVVTEWRFGRNASKQQIIESFDASSDILQRVVIIVLAVVIAPVVEELLFRFFLYGVFRRHIGRVAALVVTAGLFAAVHAHLPSFAPLFVLAACFTIAYEWSGSVLVTMTMHSLFNAAQLIALAFASSSQP